MTTFHSSAASVYVPRLGRLIRFDGGTYSTDDPAEVRVLRGHPLVSEGATGGVVSEGGIAVHGPESIVPPSDEDPRDDEPQDEAESEGDGED